MPEFNPELQAEMERQQFMEWLRGELKDYEEVFDLSDEQLRNKKILEIGAGDRRFAATCALNGVSQEVYSLEPALGKEEKPGYASKEFLSKVVEKLPQDLRAEIEKRTVVATAEAAPFKDKTFDLVLGRSVPFESPDELKERLRELLRVGQEVRFYPIDEETRSAFEAALAELVKDLQLDTQFKTTVETDVPTEEGARHVKEDVLIVKKAKSK